MTLKRSKRPQPQGTPWRRSLADLAVTMLLYLFVTSCLVQAYVIPTSSMENTLLVGDHILADKLSYAPKDSLLGPLLPYQPVTRGDIVVFHYPLDMDQMYVKRVVGVPGDRLRIVAKQVHINGEALDEPYKIHGAKYPDRYRDNFPAPPSGPLPARALEMLSRHVTDGVLVVPRGHYFVLGDNRDDSADSRYWGLVPRENIVGKPLLIYWSYDAPTERLTEFISLEHLVDLAWNFFEKTRWERSLRLIRTTARRDRPRLEMPPQRGS